MRKRRTETLFIYAQLSLCAVLVRPSLAAERPEVASIKSLLVTAIDEGEAHGVLIGPAANFIRERFKSTASIEIDVKAIASLDEAGCKRLEVTTRQDGIVESLNQAPARKQLVYQVSYCRDGRLATHRQ